MPEMPSSVNLKAELDQAGTEIQITLSRGMRAPVVNGSVQLLPVWRADVWSRLSVDRRRRPKFLGTYVTSENELPSHLLRLLADLYEQGEVTISKR